MESLIQEIDQTITPTPTLWWLGHCGFIVRFATITFYVDPQLSAPGAPLVPGAIKHTDLILSTRGDAQHLDAATVGPMLEASRRAKLVLPKSAADSANASGIPDNRMTTTDSDLRVEYFKDDLYGRIYAVPSGTPALDWTANGGYPYLGYLIRFGRWTVYHAGDSVPYEGLASRLKMFNVNVALLPIGPANFSPSAAAELAQEIGAEWVVPMGYSDSAIETEFVAHMLGHRPEQRFKVFHPGEKWTVPEE